MARYTGPKNKLSRREGEDLFGKGNKLRRLNIPPGMHGHKRRRKISEYGQQLREKQKIKRMYGVLEKQFLRYVKQAGRSHEATTLALWRLLENRLDNVVYRAGLAPTRAMARQLVVHGHVLVDGQKVDRPSYQVKSKQIVTLSTKASQIPAVKALLDNSDYTPPAWLKRKAASAQKLTEPETEQQTQPLNFQLVVEFYSR